MIQLLRWTTPSTAPDPDGASRVVRVTHPFHPWAGENFEFVVRRRTWHQDRAFFFLADGTLTSVPTAWTDVAEPDPFVVIAAGRSAFRVEDLLVVADLVETLRPPHGRRRSVRRTMPGL